MRASAVVFAGPSITADDRKTYGSTFDFLPPVRRNDIPSALERGYTCLIVIDGEFVQSLAVSPKEIMAALDRGVTVVGGSSMGALRAVEMHPYGMHGVGQIYQWYESGFLTKDDDVALLYSERGDGEYDVRTTPMVNIIWTVRQAKREGWLSPRSCLRIMRSARNLHWTGRDWPKILEKADLTAEERDLLGAYVRDRNDDLKHRDALAVMDYSLKLLASSPESE